MAPYPNSPPPDLAGWGDGSLYQPAADPFSGGQPGSWLARLMQPTPLGPSGPGPSPPGQFLPRLMEAAALARPAPPGQFLASIGAALPEPTTTLATRPVPPDPASQDSEAAYRALTDPTPTVGAALPGERVPGLGTTAPRTPAEWAPAEGDGLLMNAASGFNDGLYHVAGFPIDATTWLINRGIDAANGIGGLNLGYIEDPFLGSNWLTRAGTYLGVRDPATVRAVTPGERIARGAGEGTAYVVVPAAAVTGGAAAAGVRLGPLAEAAFGRVNSAGEVARETAGGATSAATGKAAREVAPEPLKPAAELVGNLVGGIVAPGALARPRAAVSSESAIADLGRSNNWRHPDNQSSEGALDATAEQFRGYQPPAGRAGTPPPLAARSPTSATTRTDAPSITEGGHGGSERLDQLSRKDQLRRRRAEILALNKTKGKAYEIEAIAGEELSDQQEVRPQITLRTKGPLGVKIRVDAIGIDRVTGEYRVTELKSSLTAGFTKYQIIGFPELEIYGGVVVGDGKHPHVRGTDIPPTKVKTIRKLDR